MPPRETSAAAVAVTSFQTLQNGQEKAEALHMAVLPEKREAGRGLKGLRGISQTDSRKEGIGKGRQNSDAAAQELALIRTALSQQIEDVSEDADMLLAKKLQAEELQKGRPSASVPKKRAAPTLDNFFKRQML